MSPDKSFSQFFFNALPGFYFLVLINLIFFNRPYDLIVTKIALGNNDMGLFIALFLFTLSTIVGFFLQSVTKIWREDYRGNNKNNNRKLMEDIVCNDFETFSLGFNILNSCGLYKGNLKSKVTISDIKREDFDLIRVFFIMDNRLRAKNEDLHIEDMSSRFAFWANIKNATGILAPFLVVSLMILIINEQQTSYVRVLMPITILLLIVFWHSCHLADKYFRSYYDTVQKTFIASLMLPCEFSSSKKMNPLSHFK